MKDIFTFAVDSLLIWLNGWETVENELAYTPQSQRERLTTIYKAHNVTRVSAEDHTVESQARIEKLLHSVLRIRSQVEASDREDDNHREDESVIMLPDIDRAMERYVTYPTLSLHVRSGNFAIFQRTLRSEVHELVPLTPEERQEADPKRRRHYSIGPGMTPPGPTSGEAAVMKSITGGGLQAVSNLSTREKAILAGYNKRVDAASTHRWCAPEIPYGEIAAAHAIMDLARLGAIHNVRQCGVCKIWFYAKKVDQVGCGDPKCRRERDKGTPGYAEAQAAKLQRYKDKKEVKRLMSERKGLERAAKGFPTKEVCARLEAIDLSMVELKRSIKSSEKRAAENKAKGRRERRCAPMTTSR